MGKRLAFAHRTGTLRKWALAAFLLASGPSAEAGFPVFKLYVAAPGPYRVSFEDLAAAGLRDEGFPSTGLGLTNNGHAVPVWVEDGGDGVFGPGDRLELIGELPHGWVSHFDEHTRYNVYFLRFDAASPIRMTVESPVPLPSEEGDLHTLRRDRHYERDYLILRRPRPRKGRPEELWYWAKLTHIDREPLVHNLDLGDLALDGGGTVELRIALRGWSRPEHKPDPEMADHRVEVMLNGAELATADWNGTEPFLLAIPDIASDRFVQADNALTLRIPKRAVAAADDWLIDVVMLNWIEIVYPRILQVGGRWADFRLTDPLAPRPMRLRSLPGAEFVLYGVNGSRTASDAIPHRPRDGLFVRDFYPPSGESSFITASSTTLDSPQAVVLDRPSRLRDPANRADYIMVAHRRLLEAIQPLAEYHRSRGLAVEVVDVQDVYDEFTHGLARPWALRDFLQHAYRRWGKPAPRFVLLVGDASWNGKDVLIGDGSFPDHLRQPPAPPGRSLEEDTGKLKYTPYDDEQTDLVNRHLIPTWNHTTVLGHSANDNYFVTVDDGDTLPDLAIGRLTVVEPSDVARIVEKTIRYASAPEVGPWRRSVVFLTNTSKKYHRQSRRVAGVVNAAGFSTREIYPRIEEADNEQYTRRLIESLNQGQLFVHFLGHGGRHIWETGRRDLRENRDLFTLSHVEALKPTRRLPIVLSLTCFSAPFDHPDADSLGEKFLRIADRGAVAVVAASWTNSPSGAWGHILLDELTRPGTTVGEALMRAKRRIRDPMFVNTYNLLGDPAVPVALPAAEIALSVSGGEGHPLAVSGVADLSAFSGEVLVELVNKDREPLRSIAARLEGSAFAMTVEISSEELAAADVVRAYAWDVSRGIDAAGAVEIAAALSDGKPHRRAPFPSIQTYRPPADRRGESADAFPSAGAEEMRADAVAWWSFDETDGTDVRDRLGAHHGSLIDRVDRSSGPRGGALAFYGRGYVDLGRDPRLDLGTGDFTIHAWIATRQARPQVWVILDKRTTVGYHLYRYHLYNYRGQLGLQLADGLFTNFEGPFIADGRWHHVAVTVDRDRGDGIRWYVDGTETGARQDPTAHRGSLDNPSHLYVGGRRHGGGNFVGGLDEVGIFRRALAAHDVEQLYKTGWNLLRGALYRPPGSHP